jgi:hypothetical protein
MTKSKSPNKEFVSGINSFRRIFNSLLSPENKHTTITTNNPKKYTKLAFTNSLNHSKSILISIQNMRGGRRFLSLLTPFSKLKKFNLPLEVKLFGLLKQTNITIVM